jgi:hypothetical protein
VTGWKSPCEAKALDRGLRECCTQRHHGDWAGANRAFGLAVTDQIENLIVVESRPVADRFARKLGLSQTPGKAVMQGFATRTRELVREGRTVDQAAMMAAKEKFPAEFQPTHYAGVSDTMETLLADIEKL